MTKIQSYQPEDVASQLKALGVDVQEKFPVAKDVATSLATNNLSEPETLFVIEYLSDHRPDRAYSVVFGTPILASMEPGKALLKKPDVQRIISEIYHQIGQALVITEHSIIAKLWEIANDAMSKKGEQIKALELIAKMKNLVKSVKESGTEDPKGKGFQVNLQINTTPEKRPEIKFGQHPVINGDT